MRVVHVITARASRLHDVREVAESLRIFVMIRDSAGDSAALLPAMMSPSRLETGRRPRRAPASASRDGLAVIDDGCVH